MNKKQNITPTSRRDFLKLISYTAGATTLFGACRQPIRKAIPYLVQPEEIIPGEALHYATSYCSGGEFASLVARAIDGRPVKLEGNDLCPITRGKSNARMQASILNLYDPDRLREPKIKGATTNWQHLDAEVTQHLQRLASENKRVLWIAQPTCSPTTLQLRNEFLKTYPNIELATYQPVSYAGMASAYRACVGDEIIPVHQLASTQLLVCFHADFLNTWLSPIELAGQYAEKRDPNTAGPFQHIQVESTLSLTGSNADTRIVIHPDEEAGWLYNIYKYLESLKNNTSAPDAILPEQKQLAAQLWQHRGAALAISSSNNYEIQCWVIGINTLLGAYDHAIDLSRSYHHVSAGGTIFLPLTRLQAGDFSGIIIDHVNPVYHFPNIALNAVLRKLEFSLSIDTYSNETNSGCMYLAPDHHFLESWNDFEPQTGLLTLQQPVIGALHPTRQANDSFLRWMNHRDDFYALLRQNWQKQYFSQQDEFIGFEDFWSHTVQKGILQLQQPDTKTAAINLSAVEGLKAPTNSTPTLVALAVESVALGQGQLANNPWLYELPDPLSKITWDNCLMIAPALAREYQLSDGDVVKINDQWEIPVAIQKGQHPQAMSIAMGYGRQNTGRMADGMGWNAFHLVNTNPSQKRYFKIEKMFTTGRKIHLAKSQTHDSAEGRDLVKQVSLQALSDNPSAEQKVPYQSLYPEHKYNGAHWGMVIDLEKCIGCSACVIACQAENNIPVVGKNEVAANREMHWMRIDRYYEGSDERPNVLFQPVTCQHCDQAPCENVCPVSATTHSSEGINQMVYNRCIGTRYCSNNCPYKVRRFNWRDYTNADAFKNNAYDPTGMTQPLPRLMLNPDVTVRSKGVMEKCSFCYQRIAKQKLDARRDQQPFDTSQVQTACMQACPSQAIVFGDMNDNNSELARLIRSQRAYRLLEELHTLPSVHYLAKIKHTDNE